jgi:hypothetical protein
VTRSEINATRSMVVNVLLPLSGYDSMKTYVYVGYVPLG